VFWVQRLAFRGLGFRFHAVGLSSGFWVHISGSRGSGVRV
jgi:hypothetical protein